MSPWHLLPNRVNSVMSAHYKAWAYDVSGCGDSVIVFDRRNIGHVRSLIKAAGLENEVRVVYAWG